MKIKPLYTLIFYVFICSFNSKIFAQQWLGASLSNYGGTNTAYTNPATLGGNFYKSYINGFGFGFNAINDYVSWNAPFTLKQYLNGNVGAQYKDSMGNIKFQNSWIKENLNGNTKNAYLEAELRGPAMMYSINKKLTVAFSTKSRVGVSLTKVDESIARIALNGLDSNNSNVIFNPPNNISLGQGIGNLSFNVNALSYQDYSFSAGAEVLKIKALTIKVGGAAKLLVGNACAYAQLNDVDLAVSGYDSVRVNNANFRYGYSDVTQLRGLNARSLMPSFANNLGFGWDAGLMIEYSPKAAENLTSKKTNYLFKAGISLIDMGGITFKGNTKGYNVQSRAPFSFVPDSSTEVAFSNGVNSPEAARYIDSFVGANFIVNNESPIRYNLPSMLSIQFDYNIFKAFFISGIIFQDVRGFKFKKIAVHRPSQITLIPRFEHKNLEFSMPLILTNDYSKFQFGGYARIGPVFFGCDNLKAIINQKDFYGLNTYFGFAKGIGGRNKRKKEDKAESSINFIKTLF